MRTSTILQLESGSIPSLTGRKAARCPIAFWEHQALEEPVEVVAMEPLEVAAILLHPIRLLAMVVLLARASLSPPPPLRS